MFEKICNILKIKDGPSEADADKRNDAIVLKIINKDKTIAYLSTENDGTVYTLSYTDEFPKSGVPPFNMKLSERHKVELGKTYRSEVLWYAFWARVPNPKRPDYSEALERAGLTGKESDLELIGKMSRISISRSWTVEIDEAA